MGLNSSSVAYSATVPSASRIDKLGDRLRTGSISEVDLHLLDEWRRSFAKAYDVVIKTLKNPLGLQPTGRPAKSTPSIVEKLRRETIRLTQMQDVAGCRVIVPDLDVQDEAVDRITRTFGNATIVDRRLRPSSGYRAVHVIVVVDDFAVEVQVRTALQHIWADVSEKLSDAIDPTIKYGGGPPEAAVPLSRLSELVAAVEEKEREFRWFSDQLWGFGDERIPEWMRRDRDDADRIRVQVVEQLRRLIEL